MDQKRKRGRPPLSGKAREESIERRRRLSTERLATWRADRRAAGMCWHCGKVPPRENRRTCAPCGVKASKRAQESQRQRWYDGLCVQCGEPNPSQPRRKCDRCAHADKVRVVLGRKKGRAS